MPSSSGYKTTSSSSSSGGALHHHRQKSTGGVDYRDREAGSSGGSRTALLPNSTTSLLSEVSSIVGRSKSREAKDLSNILRTPHMEALATAYDNVVAQKYSDRDGSPSTQQTFEMEVMNGNGHHNISNYILDE